MKVGVALTFATLFGIAVADKASFQVGISQVVESLGQVALDRDSQASGLAAGRKIFVEHLLGEVANAPAVGDAKINLELISEILQNITVMIGSDRDSDDGLLVAARQDFIDCPNSTAQAEETEMTDKKNWALGNHTECRISEDALANDADVDCGTAHTDIDNFLDSAHKPKYVTCADWGDNNFPTIDSSWERSKFTDLFFSDHGAAAWTDMGKLLNDRKNNFNRDVRSKGADCASDYSLWENKNGCPGNSNSASCNLAPSSGSSCSTKQHLYETAFCSFQFIITRRCSDLYACYNREEENFEADTSTVFSNAAARLRDVAVVKYVKCIIDALNANMDAEFSTINATCGGSLEISTHAGASGYNNTQLFLPGRASCSNSTAVDDNLAKYGPAHPDWLADEYTTGPNHDGATDVVGTIPQTKFILNNAVSSSC